MTKEERREKEANLTMFASTASGLEIAWNIVMKAAMSCFALNKSTEASMLRDVVAKEIEVAWKREHHNHIELFNELNPENPLREDSGLRLSR